MIRLLIADDHPIVREGLKHVVSQCRDIRVVGEAEDAQTTLELCKTVVGDVLLLDVSMPGPGVLELIARLKAQQPRLRILVLSVHPEQQYARRVLRAGADGYLTKNYSSEALASAIRQVNSGRKYVSPSLAQDFAVDLERGVSHKAEDALSNREYEVLLQLGSGRTAAQIAQRLKLSPKTVRTYRSRIFEKMGFRSTAELIFYVVQHGLVTEVAGTAADGDSEPEHLPGRSTRPTSRAKANPRR